MNGPCLEECDRWLRDALAAIDGDAAAARRTRGRALAVAAFINRNRATAGLSDRKDETTVSTPAVATIEREAA